MFWAEEAGPGDSRAAHLAVLIEALSLVGADSQPVVANRNDKCCSICCFSAKAYAESLVYCCFAGKSWDDGLNTQLGINDLGFPLTCCVILGIKFLYYY